MKTLSMTALACLLAFLVARPGRADETQRAEKQQDGQATATAEQLKENPNDTKSLQEYLNGAFRSVQGLLRKAPDEADKQLNELSELLESLKPDEQDAQALKERAESAVKFYRQQLELARVKLEDLREKLQANADDLDSLRNYISKVMQEISSASRSAPEEAEKQLKEAREFLATVAEKAENELVATQIENLERVFSSLERRIESGKKLAALIGQEAAPLDVEAWANGGPLTESDLKGKVVLLDFWAVWCGPCIATFPHLREWHEKYSDKGLVIVGLTRFYDYTWNEEAGRAVRAKEEVTDEQELAMLEKFAEEHNLHHPFAIQKDDKLSKYYGVTGIPHVVVIDQEQKIRLMRVGSGEENARAVEAMIQKLLGVEPPASDKE